MQLCKRWIRNPLLKWLILISLWKSTKIRCQTVKQTSVGKYRARIIYVIDIVTYTFHSSDRGAVLGPEVKVLNCTVIHIKLQWNLLLFKVWLTNQRVCYSETMLEHWLAGLENVASVLASKHKQWFKIKNFIFNKKRFEWMKAKMILRILLT